jgi:hypothetical protein
MRGAQIGDGVMDHPDESFVDGRRPEASKHVDLGGQSESVGLNHLRYRDSVIAIQALDLGLHQASPGGHQLGGLGAPVETVERLECEKKRQPPRSHELQRREESLAHDTCRRLAPQEPRPGHVRVGDVPVRTPGPNLETLEIFLLAGKRRRVEAESHAIGARLFRLRSARRR